MQEEPGRGVLMAVGTVRQTVCQVLILESTLTKDESRRDGSAGFIVCMSSTWVEKGDGWENLSVGILLIFMGKRVFKKLVNGLY